MAFELLVADWHSFTQNTLHKLPCEVYVLVMEKCDTPEQIQSLISADPFALSYYTRYRHCILQSCEAKMYAKARQEDLSQLSYWAARFRHLHQNFPDDDAAHHHSRANAILEDVYSPRKSSLGYLRALCRLMNDADELISHYVPNAWVQLHADFAQRPRNTCIRRSSKVPLDPIVLSRQESTRLYQAIFRFEIYSCALPAGQDPQNEDRYQTHSNLPLQNPSQDRIELYTIYSYVFNCHYYILRQINTRLNPLVQRIAKSNPQQNPDLAWEEIYPNISENLAQRKVFIKNFVDRSTDQEMEYLHWLCRQGIQLLHGVKAMGFEDQLHFTFTKFYFFVHHQAILGAQTQHQDKIYGEHCPFHGVMTKPRDLVRMINHYRTVPFWDRNRIVTVGKYMEVNGYLDV